MNTFTKGLAVVSVIALGSFGFAQNASAATVEEVQTYLSTAVAEQLGLTDTAYIDGLIADALANDLIDPALTIAASDVIDGVSTLTPEEIALLLDANLTTQIDVIQAELDALVVVDPTTPVDPTIPVDPTVPAVDDDDDGSTVEDDDDDSAHESHSNRGSHSQGSEHASTTAHEHASDHSAVNDDDADDDDDTEPQASGSRQHRGGR